MITGIHHTSFTVTDMERSLKFYRDLLGFQVISDRTVEGEWVQTIAALPGAKLRIVHLRGYGQGLELIQYLAPQGKKEAPPTCDTGSAHMCFIVDDIEAEVQRLKAAGVRFKSEPVTIVGGPNDGAKGVYFTDPDGITMELAQPPSR